MTFSIFIPAQKHRNDPPPPVLYYLSGLTCDDSNVRDKAGVFAHAARYGFAVVMPDTSPRGDLVEG